MRSGRSKAHSSEPASETALVIAELRTSNRLLAVIATKGMEQPKAIAFLDSVGFEPRHVAAALGVTPNAVSVALHRLRKAVTVTPAVADEKQVSPNGIQ